MKFNETKRVGMDIFLINIILILFVYSNDGITLTNLILASLSSLVAVGLNIYYIHLGSKTKINKLFLFINTVIAIIIIAYTIISII